MKIAIFGESPADEDALAILVTTVLGEPIERPQLPSLLARGWTQMVAELPRVIRALYYGTDTEGLLVVIDSNGKSIHSSEHDQAGATDNDCRFCQLKRAAHVGFSGLKPLPRRPQMKVAIGLAVPAFEAWLVSHQHHGINEANWKMARQERPPREPYTRQELKLFAYGTSNPSLALETRRMVELMSEAVKDIERLKTSFPGGFTPLFNELCSWKTEQAEQA